MDVVRLVMLIILVLTAPSNTVFARSVPYGYQSLQTKTGDGVWDQKVLNEIKGHVGPSISRPAGQNARAPPKPGYGNNM
uniref:Uncharacterized protein n=1 Tax=Noccaea caerulescens TaxID=107243 RepID=A0A1J3JYV6_NOCCA